MTKRKTETSGDDWRELGLNVPSQPKKHAKLPVPFKPTATRGGDVIVLELPHPHKVTHPNGRTKKRNYRAAMVREDRERAAYLVWKLPSECVRWKRVRVDATFFGTKSDETNLPDWLKAYIDGASDVLSGGQDNGYVFGDVKKTKDAEGRKFVRITFTRLD